MSAGADLDHALAEIASGRIVVVSGDRLRGGDIDLMIAARHVTPEAINFMATHGRGLICLAITQDRAIRLGLSLINPGAERQTGRPFARSIEASSGVSTGISAADRARTVQVASAEGANADDIQSPGHVFPL
ncbi:3,4-dihydroxy-2-butanone-4-phosphate synthase, partial [Blastomonas sp.]|uniref:3,4-dihydroxy-2-butanone-4-phosphate synthase n=1 Tax=Blastomonas sp. TaxID=1909299 RepID=UPI00359352F0